MKEPNVDAPMTAAELAKMLDGWPEMDGFRVVRFEGGIELKIGKMRFAQYFDAPILEPEVVLPAICMSGLRHVGKLPPPSADFRPAPRVTWCDIGTETILTVRWYPRSEVVGIVPEGFEIVAPTLLHAIDEAIRAEGAT